VAQECEGVSKKGVRRVKGYQEVGQDCEFVCKKWGRSRGRSGKRGEQYEVVNRKMFKGVNG